MKTSSEARFVIRSRNVQSLNQRGFTLVEIMIVIVIIGLLAGLALKGVPWAINAAKAIHLKVKARDLATMAETYNATFPKVTVTELPSAPSTALPTTDSSTADLTYDHVTAYDMLAAKELISERPNFWLGRNPPVTRIDLSVVDYDRSVQRFRSSAAAATRTNYSTLGYTRVETIRVLDSAADPAVARGANFFLNQATVGLPLGAVCWVLVVEGLKASEASALASWYNDFDVNSRTGTAQSLGKVAYTTPDVTTNTVTAYCYLTHSF